LSTPLHKTKGIVLRVTKYGETSLIALIYTEQFGIQSYLIQGVRNGGVKKAYQANYFQPGALLDLVVYHHEQKTLQRIKEYKWYYVYCSLMQDVIKNSILLYIIEVATKTIKQPETNPDLFAFMEECIIWLDKCDTSEAANFPIYFNLHFSSFFGFQMMNDSNEKNNVLDLVNGKFLSEIAHHSQCYKGDVIPLLKELIRVMHPDELTEISLNRTKRQEMLDLLEKYYSIHLPEFGKLKTLPIIKQLMN
jgi:DNA repair protein RecO (recombination protein O)